MQALFIEAPARIRQEIKRVMVQKITEAIEGVHSRRESKQWQSR